MRKETYKYERLTKTVQVSDPEYWYMQNTVDVSLYVTPPFKGTVQVKILISTIDDFAMSYIQEVDERYPESIQWMYDHLKEWMYDRMPDTISFDWLNEHGYLPDC